MTSATEILRRMLDERGVEWEDVSAEGVRHTTWDDGHCWFCDDNTGWTFWGKAEFGTPEQAVAATLGPGTCHMQRSESGTNMTRYGWVCSECGMRAIGFGAPSFCPNCGRKVSGDGEE